MDTTWPHVSSRLLLEKIDFTVFLITVVVARSHLWQIQRVHMASAHEDLQAQVQKTFLMWFLMEKWCLLKKMNSRKSCDRTHADQRYWRLSQWVTVSITRVSLQSSVIKPRTKDREFDTDDYTVTVQSHQRKQRTIQRQRSIKIKNDYSTGWSHSEGDCLPFYHKMTTRNELCRVLTEKYKRQINCPFCTDHASTFNLQSSWRYWAQ